MGVSRRNLHSIARNIAHKCVCSAEYIAEQALINDIKIVRADLINLKFELELFNIERNINVLKLCKDNLLRNMEAYTPFYLFSAKLVVTFDNCEKNIKIFIN